MALGTTLTRFLIEEQRKYPGASGEFTSLLSGIATAGKVISREVNKAGLIDILGGVINVVLGPYLEAGRHAGAETRWLGQPEVAEDDAVEFSPIGTRTSR